MRPQRLKPALILGRYAALKRRSSTVLYAFVSFLNPLEMLAEFRKAADDQQLLLRRRGVELFVLQYPRIAVRDEDGVQTGGQRGIDVGLRAVADHPGGSGDQIIFFDHGSVRCGVFFGDDFDSGEMLFQS